MDTQKQIIWKSVKIAALRRLKEAQGGKPTSSDELTKLVAQIEEADEQLSKIESGEGKASEKFPSLDEMATQANLARLLGVSRSTVHGHHESGLFTPNESLGVWLNEYISKLRSEAAGRPENSDDIKAVTIREKTASARLKEIQAEQLEGTLIDMDLVYQEMMPWFSHMKTQLEASGNRIATMLTAQYDVTIDKRLIDKEHSNALSEIAKYVNSRESTD